MTSKKNNIICQKCPFIMCFDGCSELEVVDSHLLVEEAQRIHLEDLKFRNTQLYDRVQKLQREVERLSRRKKD